MNDVSTSACEMGKLRDLSLGRARSLALCSCWLAILLITILAAGPALANSDVLAAPAWKNLEMRIRRGDLGLVDHVRVQVGGRRLAKLDIRRDYALIYNSSGEGGLYDYTDARVHPYYGGSDLHSLQSITKSVTALVFAAALHRGDIRSLDVPIGTSLRTRLPAGTDPKLASVTTRHLLNMVSGIAWTDDDTKQLEHQATDWTQYVLSRSMAATPGTRFNYSNGDAALLASVFKAETGIDIVQYGDSHLFRPLGIRRFYWKRSPAGEADCEGGLYLSADDLLRIGQLVADGGWVNGQRLLTADFLNADGRVARGSRPSSLAYATDGVSSDYRNLWWLPQREDQLLVFAASGFGGQSMVVVPSRRMVVIILSWNVAQHSHFATLLPGYPETLDLVRSSRKSGGETRLRKSLARGSGR